MKTSDCMLIHGVRGGRETIVKQFQPDNIVPLETLMIKYYASSVRPRKAPVVLFLYTRPRIHLERIAVTFALTKCRLRLLYSSDNTTDFALPDVMARWRQAFLIESIPQAP